VLLCHLLMQLFCLLLSVLIFRELPITVIKKRIHTCTCSWILMVCELYRPASIADFRSSERCCKLTHAAAAAAASVFCCSCDCAMSSVCQLICLSQLLFDDDLMLTHNTVHCKLVSTSRRLPPMTDDTTTTTTTILINITTTVMSGRNGMCYCTTSSTYYILSSIIQYNMY